MTAGSPDFNPAAWQRAVTRLRRDLSGLAAEDAETILRAVGADGPRSLGRLDRYLGANEISVLTPTLDCPAVVMRLARHLSAVGYSGAVPLSCSRCGRQAKLTRRGKEWICEPCSGRQRQFTCAHCNVDKTRPAMRLPNGYICQKCYNTHFYTRRPCSKCGQMCKPDRRLPDGGILCPRCAPRPQHVCSRCGETRPAQAMTDEGPICSRCYARVKLSWACALCGAVRNRQTNTAFGPNVCQSCRRIRLRNAPVEDGQSLESDAAGGVPRSKAVCAFCGKLRRVGNRWPAGPVCQPCAERTRMYPAQCARCQQVKVLTGLDATRQRICGPCAGWPVDYRCCRCDQPGIRSRGLCSRCVTRQRLEAALAGPYGEVSDQLQPLVDALASAPDPRSVAVWLGKSPAATMLSDLAARGKPITHETLDDQSPSPAADYIREILVRTAVLEPRNEYLERVTLWVDQYLADVAGEQAQVLRAYAQWYLLHKARRQEDPLLRPTTNRIRTRMRVAHEFMTFIADRGYALDTVGQDLVDNWLARGTSREHEIRPFLKWADQRGLTTGVTAAARKPALPVAFVSEEEQLNQLHRCLTDETMPVDLRAGGGLMLLYGLNLTRVLAISSNQLRQRSADTYLMLGAHELLLPPVLADLMTQLPCPARGQTLPNLNAEHRLLFPGSTPHRAIDPEHFANRLKQRGIRPRAGRNTALIQLASELPAAVLSDILGIDIATATRWAGYAKRDWQSYLASRHEVAQQL
jgi:hypothetical protein